MCVLSSITSNIAAVLLCCCCYHSYLVAVSCQKRILVGSSAVLLVLGRHTFGFRGRFSTSGRAVQANPTSENWFPKENNNSTLIRRLRFATPIPQDPPSPLPPFEEPEPPIMSGAPPTREEVEQLATEIAALPTREEVDDILEEMATLKTALTKAMAAMPTTRASSAVIANPKDFQRSPYTQPAPLDLASKSGLQLYTDAQEALKVPFNGKAAKTDHLNSRTLVERRVNLGKSRYVVPLLLSILNKVVRIRQSIQSLTTASLARYV